MSFGLGQLGGGEGGLGEGGGGPGYAPQATAFFARLGTQPSTSRKALYNTLITTLVNAGIWALLDALYIFDTELQATALTNLISSSYAGTAYGSLTFTTKKGFTGDGSTAYIDTGYVPSTDGVNFTDTSSSIGAAVLNNRTSPSGMAALGTNLNDNAAGVFPYWNNGPGTGTYTFLNTNAAPPYGSLPLTWQSWYIAGVTTALGIWSATSISEVQGNGAVYSQFYNGSLQAAVGDWFNGTPDTASLLVLACRNGGAPTYFSTDTIGAAWIGGYLTSAQVAILSNALNTYLGADGVNPYATTSAYPALASSSLSSIFSGNAASTLPAFGVNTHQSTGGDDQVSSKPIPDATNVTLAEDVGAAVVRVDAVDWQIIEPNAAASCTLGTIAANIFTAAGTISGAFAVGQTISGPGFTPVTIASLGTGSGGAGTYNLSTSPGNIGVGEKIIGSSYVWTAAGPTINALRAAGITVQLVLAYSNTNYESSYFTGPTDSTGINAFAAYCAAVVARYGATGFIYEIWNEPNISNGAGNYSWAPAASASAFATLFDAAVPAMIAANASAVIISGGLSPGGGSGYVAPDTYVASFVADATLTNVTGLGFHPYNAGDPSAVPPEQLIADCSAFATAASSAKPNYLSEGGYSATQTSLLGTAATQQRKAQFIARTFLASIIAQAKQMISYDLVNDGIDPTQEESNYGLYDNNFNPLPAAAAVASLAAAQSGCTTVDAAKIANQYLYEITFHKSSSQVRVVWSIYGSFAYTRTETSIASATATDLFGNVVPVSVNGNNWTCNVSDTVGPVIVTIH